MTTLLASLHRARIARLKRLGALSPATVIQPRISEPMVRPEPPLEPKPPPSLPSAPGLPRIHTLQACVAHVFKVRTEALAGPDREWEIVRARQAAMYLAREELHASFCEIGRRFGGRAHTTVLNGWRHASALVVTDKTFREKVERARAEFLAIMKS
jgi:chromosomal replication initiator protein